jgi:uncharacterized membrane protein
MGITFFFWLKALQMSSTTAIVSNLVYLAPFLSLVFVHYFLHEPVYYTTPLGLVLIISGIFFKTGDQKSCLIVICKYYISRNMKKLFILLSFAILGLSSCKKDVAPATTPVS